MQISQEQIVRPSQQKQNTNLSLYFNYLVILDVSGIQT